jgi:hypothetical protein
VLSGGPADRGRDRPPRSTGGGWGRLARATARRHPRATACVAGAALVLGALSAVAVTADDPPAERPAMSLTEACRRVQVYRDAELGPDSFAARGRLRAVVHRLAVDGTAAERAVRTYADATLGPPTAGPARYLLAADQACRRAGLALLPIEITDSS